MKPSKENTPQSRRKSPSLTKSKKRLRSRGRKKTQKPRSQKKAGSDDRRHLTRRASDADKTRNHLGKKVIRQAGELKIKNGQIKAWAAKEKLTEEQLYLHTKAMNSTSDGIFIIDAQRGDFPIIYSNSSFQKMVGYAKKDILGQNYFHFYGDAADQRVTKEIKQTLQQDKSFHIEMLSFRKNGEKFWNYLRIAPVRDTKGVVTHYIGIQTDVTLMRQREFEIKEQHEELLHVTRVGKLAEFVSSLAYEISQPLTAILSYAQAGTRLLKDREPKITEVLQFIIMDTTRATEVIRRLRSLLKKSDPEFEPLDINKLINETLILTATDVTVRNKGIKTELQATLPLIRGDRVQLQQVLLNLISNSLDAMEASDQSYELVIRTSCKKSGTILVEVSDSGCGIPEENMRKLFHHFFTSKSDGLGMGLSISRSIIEAHGGRLDVRNNPGRGATFYFTVPVIAKSAGTKGAS